MAVDWKNMVAAKKKENVGQYIFSNAEYQYAGITSP
jgi:hypothetical protein